MEISLIRHGKSKWNDNRWVNYQGFKNWISQYDRHGIFEENKPYPFTTLKKAEAAAIILSSDLKRSIDSATVLKPDFSGPSLQIFREIEFPSVPELVKRLKLHPSSWAVILRVSWFGGYSKECESYKEANQRAGKAAELLIEYAEQYNSVVLVGHGFFNFLIAKWLKKKGWKGPKNSSFKHWESTTYSRNKE